jgi:hypothetical protein
MLWAQNSKSLPPACGPELVGASEVIRVVAIVRWQTRGFAYGVTLLLRGATAGLFRRLREAPLVALERISLVLWNVCFILGVSPSQGFVRDTCNFRSQ